MVLLHIKRSDQSQFLYDTKLDKKIEDLTQEIVVVFNGRLKIDRIAAEVQELIKYGPMYPPEILGLTEEQVEELKLVDPWEEKVAPSGGWIFNKDPVGRRNGRQPNAKMGEVLKNTIEESRSMISKKLVDSNTSLTYQIVQRALDIIRGAVTIVYPMGLPPHENIYMELTNTEDLNGTQALNEIVEPATAQLWFAGHQMYPDKCLFDYLGRNDKSKVVIKLVKNGEGAPGREPVLSEQERKHLMSLQYRRQEELKNLEKDEDDQYLNSKWADGGDLKRQLHGLDKVDFRSKFF